MTLARLESTFPVLQIALILETAYSNKNILNAQLQSVRVRVDASAFYVKKVVGVLQKQLQNANAEEDVYFHQEHSNVKSDLFNIAWNLNCLLIFKTFN